MSTDTTDTDDVTLEAIFKHSFGANPNDSDSAATAIGSLTAIALTYRSRASLWQGRCEGQRETIDYLKVRVERLEAREAEGRKLIIGSSGAAL